MTVNRSADPRDQEPLRPHSPAAKADFMALHLALARRALGHNVTVPDPADHPTQLFATGDELDDAVDRHPANPPCHCGHRQADHDDGHRALCHRCSCAAYDSADLTTGGS